jgi:hypothetical protein
MGNTRNAHTVLVGEATLGYPSVDTIKTSPGK